MLKPSLIKQIDIYKNTVFVKLYCKVVQCYLKVLQLVHCIAALSVDETLHCRLGRLDVVVSVVLVLNYWIRHRTTKDWLNVYNVAVALIDATFARPDLIAQVVVVSHVS